MIIVIVILEIQFWLFIYYFKLIYTRVFLWIFAKWFQNYCAGYVCRIYIQIYPYSSLHRSVLCTASIDPAQDWIEPIIFFYFLLFFGNQIPSHTCILLHHNNNTNQTININIGMFILTISVDFKCQPDTLFLASIKPALSVLLIDAKNNVSGWYLKSSEKIQ